MGAAALFPAPAPAASPSSPSSSSSSSAAHDHREDVGALARGGFGPSALAARRRFGLCLRVEESGGRRGRRRDGRGPRRGRRHHRRSPRREGGIARPLRLRWSSLRRVHRRTLRRALAEQRLSLGVHVGAPSRWMRTLGTGPDAPRFAPSNCHETFGKRKSRDGTCPECPGHDRPVQVSGQDIRNFCPSFSRAEIYSRLATPQSSEVRFVPHLWMSLRLTFDQNCEKGNRDLFPPGDWSVGGHNLARRPRASSVTRAFTPGVAPHVDRTCSHRGPRAKRRVRHPSAVYGAPALARQTWVTASTRRMRSSRRLGRARTGRCTRPGRGRRVVWWR